AADHRRHGGAALDGPAIAAAAAAGDAQCRETLDRYAERLARALAGVINILDPDAIVLGGGLSSLRHLYEEVPRHWVGHIIYATVEKRDRPELAEQPVIVGGGQRGVVLACCYVARLYGVRSAMPMFKALAACPDAVVIRPDMAKYREVGRAVRAEMRRLTPLV